MKIGYARVSTVEQNEARQMEALREEGVDKIYMDKKSGNIASPGIYSGNGSTSKNTPIEDTIWINAFVVPSNGNLKYLTAYAITDKGIFFRNMNNGRWEAWLQIK